MPDPGHSDDHAEEYGERILDAVGDAFASAWEAGPAVGDREALEEDDSEREVLDAVPEAEEAARAEEEVLPSGSGIVAQGQDEGPTDRGTATETVATPSGSITESSARVMLADPDPAIRRMAVEAMATGPVGLPPTALEGGLADPDDGVRAAVVEAAAAHGAVALPLLIPFCAARRWPMAQQAALRMLPGLIASSEALSHGDLAALLSAVAAMEPPPLAGERAGLASIARAVGRDRLVGRLGPSDPLRLGAFRLLLAEGSPEWLTSLVSLVDDPVEEIRAGVAAAANLLGDQAPSWRPGEPGETIPEAAQVEEAELVSALARGLTDPEEAVRTSARSALAGLPRSIVVRWAQGTLENGPADGAALAAAVVEALALSECGRPVLERACLTLAGGRGPYLGALGALNLAAPDLVGMAATSDAAHRQDAIRLIWQVGGRAILPSLRALMADSAGPVRMAVLEVFHESSDPSGVDLARDVLKNDSSAAVRAAAIHVLGTAGPSVRLEALAAGLQDPDPDVRATAVDVLPVGIQSEAADLLLRAIRDPHEHVWQAALRRMAALPDRDLPVLWAAVRESTTSRREQLFRWIERTGPERLAALAAENARASDRSDRALAIEIAARAGTRSGIQMVLAALQDPDPLVRKAAASGISSLRTPAAVPALSRALGDPQTEVRVEAVRALGLIDDDGVPPLLISALKDPEVRVRDMARDALSRSRSPAVARLLASALSTPDLRGQAGDLLEHMGTPAVDPLVDVITGSDPEAAMAAGALLERIAGPQVFVSGLSSLDPEERLRAVEVLGALRGPTASEALLTTLFDPEQRVRIRAITLLGELGDPRAIEPLKRTLRHDPVQDVAGAAERALRALGALPQTGD